MSLPEFKNYRFEDLEVWKIGLEIIRSVYELIKKFPPTEQFGLSDQLRRAATSIGLNIAEGSGQNTKKSFRLYLDRSKSSLLECVACIKIAEQESWVIEKDLQKLNNLLKEEYFKIISLRKSLISEH